jgi:hypothetical protein
MPSPRAELARKVLDTLAHGGAVTFQDAIQLRKSAVSPQDAMLSLEEIARGILSQEDDTNAKAADNS